MTISRNYQSGDYEKIICFLRELYKLNDNQYWLMAQHWDNYENDDENELREWHEQIRVWEDNNKIVAVASTAYNFGVYLDIHPDYYNLTGEMIEWAETIEWVDNELVTSKDGKKEVYIWSTESNKYRNKVLTARGYIKPEVPIYLNEQCLDKEIEKPQVPEGYIVRSMSEDIELLKRYEIGYKAFNSVEEYVPSISEGFYARINAPMYRKDLDIVTEYKDGTLTSCCILWYDEETKTGVFEPVGTHPDHRRKGLAKAGMLEAMNRLKELGATTAYVNCYGDERLAFYTSTGFENYDKGYFWKKLF